MGGDAKEVRLMYFFCVVALELREPNDLESGITTYNWEGIDRFVNGDVCTVMIY